MTGHRRDLGNTAPARQGARSPFIALLRNLAIALAAVVFLHGEAHASHALGGDLSYSCLGNHRYLITLHFYRDCNGVAAPTNCGNGLQFKARSIACNANVPICFNTNPTVEIITPICATEVDRCVSTSGTYGVERYTYTKIIDLSDYAGCATDWEIYWTLCCRNNAITSLQDPGNQNLYLSAKLTDTPGNCNTSPVFTNSPSAFFCLGEPISYNPGAVDPDGDSLVYALIPARTYGGVPIPYQPGYSATQPIKNNGGADAVVLDPQTGTMTVTPSVLQVSVVSYQVTEYRNGVMVGQTSRDVQVVVRPCTGNSAPTASGINGTGAYTMQVCAGTPVSFTVNSNDVNAGQSVSMNWNAGIPTANFTVSSSTHPTGTFTWTPTAANIGNNTFTVHVQDNGCPLIGSNDFGFSINVTAPLTAANAGPDQSVCGGNATLAGVLPFPGTQGTWTVVGGSGTFADPHAPNSAVSGLSTGANVFQWTVDYQTCGTQSDQVIVTGYDPAQAAATAGPDQEFCLPTNSATLTGDPAVAPATGTWTLVNGTGTITALHSPNTTVTGLSVGPNRFRWTINNGPCPSTQDEVVITIYSNIQSVANAGPDIAICSPTSMVTMNANAVAAPATGSWSVVSGTGTITSPNSRNTTITGLPVGVHVFRWSISNGPCTPAITTDDVTVTVYSSSGLDANAGPDQQVCSPGNVTLAGSVPTFPATGVWTVVSGTGTITAPSSATTTVSGLGIGVNVFQWTVNNGPCTNGVTSDQVAVTAYDHTVSGSNAGPDQSLCTPIATTTMAANAPTAPAQGTWTLVSGSGTITSIHGATTTVTGLAIGENIFRWDVSNGPCPVNPPNDLVSIFVYDVNAPVAQAGPDQQLCTPSLSTSLAGNAVTAPGIGTWTVIAGTGTFANAHDATTTVSGLSVGTNTFRWTLDNGPCANPVTNDDVTIVVFNTANAVANAGPDQELCRPTTSATLAGSALSTPATGQWTLVSGSGTLVSPDSPTSQVTGLATGDNIFRWTVSNGPCANGLTMDEVLIRVFDNVNPAANAGPDQQLCSDANATTMAGSSLTYPATGQWTLVNGSGTIADPTSPTTAINGLAVGENVFQWSVSNGPCPGSTGSDTVSLFVFSNSHPAITVSADQSICVPTSVNQVTVSGTIPVAPATGGWTLVSGSGTIASPHSPSTVISDMGIGVNVFQWTVSNGPCTFPGNSAQVAISVYNAATPTADAGPDQSLCTPITSTTLAGSVLVGPATGQWTVISGTGVFADATDPATSVSGLSLGANVFRWSVNNGPCAAPTHDQVTISLFNGSAQQADAGPDQELCDDLPTTVLAANMAVAPATGSWSVLQGTANFISLTDPHTVIDGLSVGVNILVWSLDNGGCGTSADQVSITVFDQSNPVATAGPDQQLCTPVTSTTLTGSTLIAPATGLWTLVSGTGNIVSPTSPTTQVNGLGAGVNTFRWTVSNGPCPDATTFDEVAVDVFTSTAQAANAGPDQAICTPTVSATLAANTPVSPAVGTWSVLDGAASFADLHDPNTTATGLQVGTTVLEWTIDNGTCGITSDQISVNVFDVNNPPANAGPDQQFCLPTNSASMGGSSLTAPATGEWTLVAGTGTIADPTSPTTAITGLSIGENIFRWTVENGPCAGSTTQDDVSVTIFDNTVAGSDAGPDQSLCTPATTTTMAASAAPSPAQGTWTLVSGNGTVANANDPQTVITGLAIGENVFRWSVSNGACPVNPPNDLVSIFVYDAGNPVANAGTDQQLCTPNTATTLSGSTVIFPAQGTWTLVSGSGNITDPGDPTTGVTGLGTGANVFRWSVTNGPCAQPLTTDQVTILVFDNTSANADAGPDQSFCTPQESTTLAGNTPTFPATGTWTLVQGTANITDPGDPSTTVTGLGVGENILAWTVSNGPCAAGLTTDQVSIFVFDANTPNASAGDDQELCSPTSSTTFAGSAVTFPAVGTWTLIAGTGTVADVHGPNSTVSGLGIGANTFQWSVSNGLCGSTNDEVTIFVFASNNAVADAGPDQEFCDPADIAVMAASAVTYPALGLWTLVSGSATITDPTSPITTISDLQIGENIFVWTVTNGPCADPVTTDTVSIRVFDHLNLPAAAGPDQQLCTPMTSTTLAGSPIIFPAAGTWTVTQGSAVFTDLHSPTSIVSGLGIGENILRWTVSNGPCEGGISFDDMTVTVFDSTTPAADAGPDQGLCQPDTFTTMAGSSVIFPATGTWTLVTGTGDITDPTSPTTTITGLSMGENVFQWSVVNGPCANASTSDLVSIFVYDDANPMANAGNDQQVCTPLTGTNFAGSAVTFPATGHWALVSGQGDITDPTDPLSAVENLGVGENVFSWTVDNGPCGGITTDQVSIFLFNLNAPPAAAGTDQSFCSPTSSATLSANTPTAPAIGVWALVQGTAAITDVNDPETLVSDLSIGENILTWTIDNGVCGISTDSISIFIYDADAPPAGAGPDQQYCTPQDSTLLVGNIPTFPAQGTWTLLNGAGLFADVNDPGTKVTGLAIGANTFVWTVDNGPCADAITTDTLTVTIFSDSTAAANAGEDISICLPANSVQLNADIPQLPATGVWTVLSGTGTLADPSDPHTQITALGVGETILLWTLDNGPCPNNGIMTDTMMISIFDPFAPVANAGPDISNCTPADSTVMAGNTPLFPSVGTWELVSGTGIIADIHDPSTAVTGLSIGTNVFTWSIFNGDCGFGPPTVDTVKVFLFDANAPGAFAGDDLKLCLPITSVQLFADIPEAPGSGTWTILSGAGVLTDPNDPHTEITGLDVGITTLLWTVYNGPCPAILPLTDTLSISIYDPFGPTANAGPDISNCTPNDSASMAGNTPLFPAQGTWSLEDGTGTIADAHDPTTMITGLSIGDNVFTWTIYNGNCGFGPPTVDTVHVHLFDGEAAAANAGSDLSFCTPLDPFNLSGNAATAPGIGFWSVLSGMATLTDPADPNTAVTSASVGDNILVWTVDNGPCGITSDTMHVVVFDGSLAGIDAGPDQVFCMPADSAALAATPVSLPSMGTWSVTEGSGTFSDVNDPNTVVSGIAPGINIFTWTVENGPCGTVSDQMSIRVFDNTITSASAGPDQELCSPVAEVTLAATGVALPAQGSWTILSGPGSLSDPGDPSAILNGADVGQTVLTWSVDNGPCNAGLLVDTVVVTLFDGQTQPAADAGPDQQFCEPGPVDADMFSNNAVFPAVGVWTTTSDTPIITSPADNNTTVTGIGFGSTSFTWTIDNGVCGSSSDDMTVQVFDSSVPPAAAGPDQQICQDTTTAQLAATPVPSTATGHWELLAGHGNLTDPTLATTEVTGLEPGTNLFLWVVDNGACGPSSDSVSIVLLDCSTLVVPDAFSPNGDGTNDLFVVKGLEYYPNNSFQVFNRWGSKVYERSPYTNTWTGKSEGKLNWGKDLPESTYYFILDPGDGKEVITGYIYLRR
jgi:gliding motility-associated-like protein